MTTGKLCYVLVTTWLIATLGCGGDLRDANESQASQDITQCELDCPNGPTITCTTLPCSVKTATSLDCSGTITNCPSCVPQTCGSSCGVISDGCGGTLDCGPCCVPLTCAGMCGIVSNGCGSTLHCRPCLDCGPGQTSCGDGTCVPNGDQCP